LAHLRLPHHASQGPYFSEIELATIAQDLDAKERQLMMESGVGGDDFLKYMAEGT
jgi:ataxin-3